MKFEVGNTVYAMGRVTRVEKVYANGNFKLASIPGQWRQTGSKAGEGGYRNRVEHYTDEVRARHMLEKARARFQSAIYAVDSRRYKVAGIADVATLDVWVEQLVAISKALDGEPKEEAA